MAFDAGGLTLDENRRTPGRQDTPRVLLFDWRSRALVLTFHQRASVLCKVDAVERVIGQGSTGSDLARAVDDVQKYRAYTKRAPH
ncbi:hypothetical protein CIB48_g4524 [Xylaria polymorpha]|nr:hypothetical protein CIB48_g4524 [Xylaria polymorpha]